MGKKVKGGQFKLTGSLNKPPLVLLNAVAGLEAEHMVKGSKIPQFLSVMLVKYPKMQANFIYQGASNDQLYLANYNHLGGDDTCESCNASKVKDRRPRHTLYMDDIFSTVRNVIKIVKALGERYLWTDSICVAQDSVERCPQRRRRDAAFRLP